MTTIDARVAAPTDDANELSTGTVQTNTGSFNVDQANEWLAFRVSVTIPDGATIDVAYLTLQFDSGTLDEPDLTIYGEDTATPAAYAAGTGTFSISGRARTTASVNWGSTDLGAPGAFNSPSIVAIIEELMASYSYAAGAYMAFMWTSRANDSTRDAQVVCYDGNAGQAPLLHIEYTEGGAGAQTISPDLIAVTGTVYAPTVTRGAVTVAPSLIAATTTVYSPTVTTGAVVVSPDFIASATAVYEPTLTSAVSITPDFIASVTVVYEPVVTPGSVTLAPERIEPVTTVYAPVVTTGAVTVAPGLIAATTTVYEPTVSIGALTLYPTFIAASGQVYAPTVLPGAVTILVAFIASGAVVYNPTVSDGSAVVPLVDVELSDHAVTLVALADSAVYNVTFSDSAVYNVALSDSTR